MSHLAIERRRVSRAQPIHDPCVAVDVSLPVRVLDISRSGVLLESKAELLVGDRAELIVTIADRSFPLVVEVRHVSVDSNPRRGMRYKAGAVFVSASAEQRSVIEQLLGAERI
jgi:hypothetical protein